MKEAIGIIIVLLALALLHPKVGEWLETFDRINVRQDLGEYPDIDEAESRYYDYMSDLGAWARGDGPEPKAYWEVSNE